MMIIVKDLQIKILLKKIIFQIFQKKLIINQVISIILKLIILLWMILLYKKNNQELLNKENKIFKVLINILKLIIKNKII